jgi:hypothetical protein
MTFHTRQPRSRLIIRLPILHFLPLLFHRATKSDAKVRSKPFTSRPYPFEPQPSQPFIITTLRYVLRHIHPGLCRRSYFLHVDDPRFIPQFLRDPGPRLGHGVMQTVLTNSEASIIHPPFLVSVPNTSITFPTRHVGHHQMQMRLPPLRQLDHLHPLRLRPPLRLIL